MFGFALAFILHKKSSAFKCTTLLFFLLFHAEFMVTCYEVSRFYFLESRGDVLADFRAITTSGVELTTLWRIDGAWIKIRKVAVLLLV